MNGAPGPVWAVGVTTVPSRVALLKRTLASLARAGFDKPRLFVDGWGGRDDSYVWALARPGPWELEVTARHPQVGPWGNWFLALHELNVRHPGADRYAVFQDDLEICLGVREYLDASELPFDRGYLNLFCFLDNDVVLKGAAPGWHVGAFVDREHPVVARRNKLQRGCGALALVFDRAGLELMLSSSGAAAKPKDPRFGDRHVDGQAAATFNAAGLREMVHVPSLVRHLGDESTIDKRPLDQRLRFPEPPAGKFWTKNANTYPGPLFDAMSLLAK